MPALKEKPEKFCQAYVISRNATAAAKEAGYSERSAYNQGYELLKRTDVQERIDELEEEYNTDVDVISELEKQYEQAKINGNGATALKALELLSRVRGNNATDIVDGNLESLEDKICSTMYIIGKQKMYELFMKTFPEDFKEEEDEEFEEFEEIVAQVMEEDKEILEQLDD
ncbi:terminase small subunit [bacterium]|nr:terminase small subunit [bacterium]